MDVEQIESTAKLTIQNIGGIDGIAELETHIDRLRTQKKQLKTELNDIQSGVRFNQEQLEERAETFAEVFDNSNDGVVIDESLPEKTVTCWTCGSDVDTEQIEKTCRTN